jgi:hypothetical protein
MTTDRYAIETPPSYAPISYIWIGELTDEKKGISGHDFAGPMAMAAVNKKNPIFFYCLDAYKAEYERQFSGHKNIEIVSIEAYLEKGLRVFPELVAPVKNLFDTSLNRLSLPTQDRPAEPVSTRDRVTVKDAMAFLLLYAGNMRDTATAPGFIIDTNVRPSEEGTPLQLPCFDKIYIPGFNSSDDHSFDCWAMYSPRQGTAEAKYFLTQYLAAWRQAQEVRIAKGAGSLEYFDALGKGLMSLGSAIKEGTISTWETSFRGEGMIIKLPMLGIRKTYYNTHKPFNRARYDKGDNEGFDMAFRAVIFNHPEVIQDLVEAKQNMSEPLVKSSENMVVGMTPLHYALKMNYWSCVCVLLKGKANLLQQAQFPAGPQTPSQMMKAAEARTLLEVMQTENIELMLFFVEELADFNQKLERVPLLQYAEMWASPRVPRYIIFLLEFLTNPVLTPDVKIILSRQARKLKTAAEVQQFIQALTPLTLVVGSLYEFHNLYRLSPRVSEINALKDLSGAIKNAYEKCFSPDGQMQTDSVIRTAASELQRAAKGIAERVHTDYKRSTVLGFLFESDFASQLKKFVATAEVKLEGLKAKPRVVAPAPSVASHMLRGIIAPASPPSAPSSPPSLPDNTVFSSSPPNS